MPEQSGCERSAGDLGSPDDFPTHRHSPQFWEELGRAVATFGFLEEVLGRAIFAFTGTRRFPEEEIAAAHEAWLKTLEGALSDTLGRLIGSYETAVKEHEDAAGVEIDNLLSDLRAAAELRNVLCHGSWGAPDIDGKSVPRFADRKMRIFETPLDTASLRQVRVHVVSLILRVIDTVTDMGWQFPGSRGPGVAIFQSSRT